MLTTELVDRILTTLPGATVGLLGDLFLDRYFDIDPALDEPSVETGLTAYQVTRVRNYPGALGTVLNNLAALGVGRIVPVSLIGDDGEGYELRKALGRIPAVDASAVVMDSTRQTPTYAKPMRGAIELNRLDSKNRTVTPMATVNALRTQLEKYWSQCDAWIVLDQVSETDCGVVTGTMRSVVEELAKVDRRRFVLADSRERIGLFRNVSVKPNHAECERACHGGAGELAKLIQGEVFCTSGDQGIVYCPGPGQELVTIPAYPVIGPTDVCGAGDSCSAGITAARMAGVSPTEAAAFGNLIASFTVTQLGTTGTANPKQVINRWDQIAEVTF